MTQQIHLTGNDDGQRLDRYLRKEFPQIPLSSIYKLLRQEKIKIIRGERKFHGKKEDMLRKGDIINLYFDLTQFGEKPVKESPNFDFLLKSAFFKKNFRIHFEDEYFYVAEKNAGIAVHPGSKTPWGHSLIDLFVAFTSSRNPSAPEPKLVHRLDKETSGLILISKNDATLRKFTAMIRDGKIEKKYLTLIRGKLSREKGEIKSKLLRTEGSKFTKIQVSRSAGAKESRTLYQVQKYFSELDASLLEVTLDTGRMHQIRVHFSSLGNPLAGDEAYGNFEWNRMLQKKYGLKRHFLHAYKLTFKHPESGELLRFEWGLPEDLKKILPSS